MSIQALKDSLPQLDDAAFERTYRAFFIKSIAPVLGYEVSRATGLRQGDWDAVLDCFQSERERRYNFKNVNRSLG